MAELTPDILADVLEACTAGAEQAAAALARCLDTQVKLTIGEPDTVDTQALPEGFDGPGLAIVLTVGQTGALMLVAESTGLLPAWYASPDAAAQSKLATLAQELGMLLLPETYIPDDFKAARVESLSGALARGGVSNGAAILPLEIASGDGPRATAYLIWPAPSPAHVTADQSAEGKSEAESEGESEGESEAEPKPESQPDSKPPSAGEATAPPKARRRRRAASVDDLPPYAQSLLRIKLPVVVTLARSRQPAGRILELGPGSIIQFEKSCEEMMELDVGGRSIATGEAVKVGDKFGLRINAMTLPGERFFPVRRTPKPRSG